jgi:hypothetical protein
MLAAGACAGACAPLPALPGGQKFDPRAAVSLQVTAALLATGMPAALTYGSMQHRLTSPCVGAGRSDWTARLVNGFVNETRRNCPYRVERGVTAWTLNR